MKETKIGIVSRGTIVELAKSMCRAKILECEGAIRQAKYGREPDTFKPSDAPVAVREDAKRLAVLRRESDKLKRRLDERGYDVSSDGALVRAYRVRNNESQAARVRRNDRLAAARQLREQTLIGLISAKDAPAAACILRDLRRKLDAI
jgi:hypothetical protein